MRASVSGDMLLVAAGDAGLRVIDISDPASPTEVGFLDTAGSVRRVAVTGVLALVADAGSGLRVIDISDPASPTEVGFLDTPGSTRAVAVTGDLALGVCPKIRSWRRKPPRYNLLTVIWTLSWSN